MTPQEAINNLNDLKQYYNDKNEDSYVGFDDKDNEAIDMAIKALEQTRWTPVSEKNPNETGEYLTTIKWLDRENVYRYRVVKRDYFAEVDTWNDSLVIAWMPSPQPYAESEDEE